LHKAKPYEHVKGYYQKTPGSGAEKAVVKSDKKADGRYPKTLFSKLLNIIKTHQKSTKLIKHNRFKLIRSIGKILFKSKNRANRSTA